ncbi:MAG: polymer-forming cytoskeletal protein [Desulfobulbaceae bacterium]|nr:polymer-forming cytoskeletal protein [Desulfobulbaceae bacterium]
MFTKKTVNVKQEMKKVESEAISSIIDKSMTITGEVIFKGKARIDGTINGNIDGEHLILSETGKIIGDIKVTSFNCYGALEGNIHAEMLTARKDSTIIGKLEAGTLTVEPGAAIQGEIKAAAKDLKLVNSPATSPSASETKSAVK